MIASFGENNSKKVRCIETGEIFESVKAAAESVGRKSSTMSRHLHGNTKFCGNYSFEFYVEEQEEQKEQEEKEDEI